MGADCANYWGREMSAWAWVEALQQITPEQKCDADLLRSLNNYAATLRYKKDRCVPLSYLRNTVIRHKAFFEHPLGGHVALGDAIQRFCDHGILTPCLTPRGNAGFKCRGLKLP